MDEFDVVVVGAGHAGCEAALVSARGGMRTLLLTMSLDSVAVLACNPSIGGTAKGHLVREIDALGGQMALNIDQTFLQMRMLNSSKGPAVQSLRAQADKGAYQQAMLATLFDTPNLTVRQGEAVEICLNGGGQVLGVKTATGSLIPAKAVVVATGVYLNARIITGEHILNTGPMGLRASLHLSEAMAAIGVPMRRFKTGTPARLNARTIDFSSLQIQPGEKVGPFSFLTPRKEAYDRPQMPCYLTYTNEKTHAIIRDSLNRSPLYQGVIQGVGARYCPSIEDKIVRFADKSRHPVFLEPENKSALEYYAQGLSTSLPEDVQWRFYRTIPGLENVQITRPAYAIEYDCIDPTALKPTLMIKDIPGLFVAGQMNGSSGYEEAGAQGIVAGINAMAFVRGLEPLVIGRNEGYVGVLIDDLVTKGTNEPYRMMTSRAEYRLSLRQDNADLRLTHKAAPYGHLSPQRIQRTDAKRDRIAAYQQHMIGTNVRITEEINAYLGQYGERVQGPAVRMDELLKRPKLTYPILKPLDKMPIEPAEDVEAEALEIAELEIKYEGYLNMQRRQIQRFAEMEQWSLPEDMDYMAIEGLRIEARQKLNTVKPLSVGQASRISGVSPGDITVLLIECARRKEKSKGQTVNREMDMEKDG